jgi:hypothetical protein
MEDWEIYARNGKKTRRCMSYRSLYEKGSSKGGRGIWFDEHRCVEDILTNHQRLEASLAVSRAFGR